MTACQTVQSNYSLSYVCMCLTTRQLTFNNNKCYGNLTFYYEKYKLKDKSSKVYSHLTYTE